MGILSKVRAAGIRAEIFPDAAKMKKQMSYANTKNIPFVAIVGENEMNEGGAEALKPLSSLTFKSFHCSLFSLLLTSFISRLKPISKFHKQHLEI